MGGKPVRLRAKCFDMFFVFAARPDHLFLHEELIDLVWGVRAVSPDVVKGCVRELRQALGDDAQSPRIIETVAGHGYRLMPTVEFSVSDGAPDTCGTRSQETRISAIPDTASVAVLKLHPAGDADVATASALGRDLANGLARTRWLIVAAPYSSLRLSDDPESPSGGRRAAEVLGVRYLLHGKLKRLGDNYAFEAGLSDALENTLVWSARIERSGIDISELMDEICAEVTAAVECEIEAEQRRRAELSPVRSIDAWSGFHRGMTLLQSYLPTHFKEIETTLRLAARADPACARVAAARSYLIWQQVFLDVSKHPKDDISRSRELATESIALDPRDPFGHWAFGRAALLDREPETAIESFRTAVDLNPSYAVGHYSLGHTLRMLGHYEEAIVHSDMAIRLSPIDPLSYAFRTLDASLNAFLGDPRRARAQAKRAAEHPNAHPYVVTAAAWVHEICGDREAALRYIKRVRQMSPGYSRRNYLAAFRTPIYSLSERREIEAAFDRLGF